jgi:hypothetical protein
LRLRSQVVTLVEQFVWDRVWPSTRWKLPIQLLLILFFVLCSVLNASAQTTTSGGLTGVVTDPSNAVVPDASIEIRDSAKGTIQATKTDREGLYQFFFLAPGKYNLTVARDGFRNESRAVNVLLGPPVTVNVTLEIAKESTTVKVTGEAPLVQAENGDVSATMNQKQISEVPNPGNDLTYVVQTAPGVVMNTDMQGSTNFSILGMPGNSYLYTTDGVNNNDNFVNMPQTGTLGLLLGQNQIQEATVVSNGFSGQFGGAAGGNINFLTKSGTGVLHGNAQYYWNGRALNANDWFDNASGNPRPFINANQWAASLSGPIKKDKLFFFFDTEGLRVLFPQIYPVDIPSLEFEAATLENIDAKFGSGSASSAFYGKIFSLYDAAPGAGSSTSGGLGQDDLGCSGFVGPNGLGTTVPCARHFLASRSRPSQDSLFTGRVDWNVNKNDRAFLRLQYDGGQSAAYTDPVNSAFDSDVHGTWWQGQLLETHTFGSSAASQFLIGGSYSSFVTRVQDTARTLSTFPTSINFGVLGTFASLGNSFATEGIGNNTTSFQLSEDLVKMWGKHKFGFGGILERRYWTLLNYSFFRIGNLSPQTLDAFYQGGVDRGSPDINYTRLFQSFPRDTSERITFLNLGFYGQDEWHVRPYLNFTFALRAEHQSNPVCQRNCFARLTGPFESLTHDPSEPYNQAILINLKEALPEIDEVVWSPRFSFAWQPFGVSHNTVLRGGFGIFYDPLPGALALYYSLNPPLVNGYTVSGNNLTPEETTSLFKDAASSNLAFLKGFAAGATLAQIQAANPNFSPPGISVPEQQTHPPQFQRWSLELQQAFAADTSIGVGYFGNHGIHEMVSNPSANAYGFGTLPRGLCSTPPSPPCADPRFSEVTTFATVAVSNYNGLVASFLHRFSRWGTGQLQINYTYGHAFDEVSNGGLFSFTFGSTRSPQDPSNLRGAYGPAEYDVRHSLNANYVWELPVKAALRGHGPGPLLEGWQVAGTIFFHTGYPYSAFDAAKASQLAGNNFFGPIYAVPVGPSPPRLSCGKGAAGADSKQPCLPPQVLPDGTPNPNAYFIQAGCETGFNTGNLPGPKGPCDGPAVSFAQGRNQFRGPSYFNTDFSILKRTRIPGWENGVLEIGAQFFNLFNHANFSVPDNNFPDPTFGQIFFLEQPPTSILGTATGNGVAPASARMIQLKAQFRF